MDREKVHVQVDEFIPYSNEKYSGFKLLWSGNIGFGEYEIYYETDKPDEWYADSECMDTNEDKSFIELLIKDFIKKLKVNG